uniref:Uncharacterized protein n=1 Tax=Setaria italica TaxID=4555 RepID=K3ZYZ2_SETIT
MVDCWSIGSSCCHSNLANVLNYLVRTENLSTPSNVLNLSCVNSKALVRNYLEMLF